jgi:antitoxin component HigA of HigAB toxin-antitoxin module
MQVPQTEEAFEQLKVDNPYLAMKFEQELGRVYQENMTWAANHLKSQADVKAHNENALTSGISEIREYVKQYGLTITDEAAKVLSDAVAADINSYEDRYGVKFLRTGAVKSRYLSTDFATNIEAVIQTARQQAAIEAGKKIQEAGARAIRTVSTAAPTSREQGRNKSRKVDVNDPDQLAQLSDAEVDNMTR